MANVRDFLYRNRRRFFRTQAREVGEARVVEGNVAFPLDQVSGKSNDAGAASTIEAFAADIPQTNPRPDRQTIHRMPTKWVRRGREAVRLTRYWAARLVILADDIWRRRWWREKTPIEMEEIAERKRRAKLASTFRREGHLYSKRASRAFARMRQHYVPNISDRSFLNKERRVEFDQIIGEPNAIHMRIATRRLPYGVNIRDLVDNEDIITNVAASLGRPVEGMFTIKSGAWLTVSRGQAARGIPQKADYLKLMELMPADAGQLAFPLGIARNTKRIYRDIVPFPHLLIGGATGSGKTNFVNALILSLISRNTPDDIKLVMADLKGGVELGAFSGIPHLWKLPGIATDGIVIKDADVIPLLEKLIDEGERRLGVFARAKVSNIFDYNRGRRKHRMGRIILLIDEWARVAYQPAYGKKADILLANITATFRAVGFHVILATQRPTVQVVSGLIKTNFNARLAFGVPSNVASMVILDNGDASNIGDTPGRAIFRIGTTQAEIQTPLVEPFLVRKTVKEIIERGGQLEQDNELSMDEVFEYSLKHLEGSLARRALYEQFKNRVGYHEFMGWLQEYDGKIVDIGGLDYQVIPANGGATPRRLEIYS